MTFKVPPVHDRHDQRHDHGGARPGGKHVPAIGTSTSDRPDREVDLAALRDFEAAWEAIRFGVASGRGW